MCVCVCVCVSVCVCVLFVFNILYFLYQIEADDIGPLLKIRVGHDGKGSFAGWCLEKVGNNNNNCLKNI